jgi:hypothetical protein
MEDAQVTPSDVPPWAYAAGAVVAYALLKQMFERFVKRLADASEGYGPLKDMVGDLKAQQASAVGEFRTQAAKLEGIHGRFTEHHQRLERLESDVVGLRAWRDEHTAEVAEASERTARTEARTEVLIGALSADLRRNQESASEVRALLLEIRDRASP